MHRKAVGVIGARLSSSRLPGKHLLELAGEPMIAHIFRRLERIEGLDELWLATTAEPGDRPLVEWAERHGKRVFAYSGGVDDLVGRVDAVARASGAGILAYFCGDSPLIEPATLSRMIRALRDDPAADRACLTPPPGDGKWIHEGFDLYTRPLWEQIERASIEPHEREHVGSAGRKLGAGRCVTVAEEPVYARLDHRISVDTPSDYRFMSALYERWYVEHPAESIVSLAWVIDQLERDPRLRGINAEVRQKGLHSRSENYLLLTAASPETGLGHLRRCLAAAHALQDQAHAGVQLLIQGPPLPRPELELLPHHWLPDRAALLDKALELAPGRRAALLDLPWREGDETLLDALRGAGLPLAGIDVPAPLSGRLALDWRPSFYLPEGYRSAAAELAWGWECYLLPPAHPAPRHGPPRRLLVMIGGGDPTGLGERLPERLDRELPAAVEVHWVRGPYAPPPRLPREPRLGWRIHHAPADPASLMAAADFALCVYGVGFFELLGHGVPTVVFSPYGERDRHELAALARQGVAEVAHHEATALEALTALAEAPERAAELGRRATRRLDGRGPQRLASRLQELPHTP